MNKFIINGRLSNTKIFSFKFCEFALYYYVNVLYKLSLFCNINSDAPEESAQIADL